METPERRERCGCGCERPVPHVSFATRRPPGLVFYPLDHQLIAFLRRKLSGRPLRSPHPFMDLNVYKHNPQHLSKLNGCGEREKEWYFFTTRDRKYKNGTRPNREAGGGFWRATGSAEEIVHDEQVIGWKRSLVYYLGKPQDGVKTDWIMHEFTAKDADYNNNNNNPNRMARENDMQLDGYVICKIHKKRNKLESDDRKEEGSQPSQRKRKSRALTKDGCKAPHKHPGNHGSHTESSSPVPGPNDGAPLEPWGQAPIAGLLNVCGSVPVPDQKQQQPQAAKKGTICFEHTDTLNDPVVNAGPLDMFDLWETQEQQQETANDGAINYSHPNVPTCSAAWPPHMPFISSTRGQQQTPTDQAAVVDFDPANNAFDDSISNRANTIKGLSLAHEDGSAFMADFVDDLLDSNESSLWRHFDYKEFKVVDDI